MKNDILIAGLSGENIEQYYKAKFNQWLFKYSDKVTIDKKIISKSQKIAIEAAFYNINPKPKSITVSNCLNGSQLTESRFIRYEIERIEKIKNLSLPKQYIKEDYLNFLHLKTLQHQQNTKTKKDKPKEKPTFKSLFRDPDNAKKVKDILKIKGYLNENYNWIGLNGNKTELLAAYYSLREKGILQSGKINPQALSFYNYFGLKIPEYMDKRNFTTSPASEYIEEFDVIFSSIN